jgi:L-lactate dehydrogenase complex protein LldF
VYGAVGGHAYGAVYSGPIGAALMPGLVGVVEAQQLPHASTFCGRCDAVCPVKIPLTRIMRHWRNLAFEQGMVPRGTRVTMKLWAWFARRPRLYGPASAAATSLLRMFGKTRVRWLPVLRGWFKERHLPAPAPTSFQDQWRARKPHP